MSETNFENAELNLVIIDKSGVATTAFLRQSDSSVVIGPASVKSGDIAVFDGTTGKVIGASGVKTFEASISQSGTSDPIIAVLRSTLDFDVVSVYQDVGIYSLEIGPYALTEFVMIEIGNGRVFIGTDWLPPNLVTIRTVIAIPFDTLFIHTYAWSRGSDNFLPADDILHITPLRITAYPH